MPQPDTNAARQPRSVRPRRMDALATLPVFFKLSGQRVVIAGGSEAAAWKAELLSAAGATVEVYAPDPCAEIEALAADPPRGHVLLARRAWSARDFESAALVIGASDEEAEARRIFDAARKAGIPVNVIDKPAFSSFQFGAIVNRSPLVVGISTDGAAPVFAQAIRSRIEALLPAGFARWATIARAWRTMLVHLDLGPAMRRTFWERFSALALAAPDRAPTEQDLQALLAGSRDRAAAAPAAGSVLLVGAGPGDPELLTLKAVRALRSADVILFDDLVAPGILDFARREAKRMLVGKTGHQPSCRQDDVNALMVGLAKSGKRVVRLKSGDPMIFGRAGEEIAALQQAGVPVEVVPGVTAAQGAAASLKVSLTHRAQARRVQFVTGHAHNGQLPLDINLAALADSSATTAVYMPLATLGLLSKRLLATGADPNRPASLIANATRPEETVISGTLATLPRLATGLSIEGPCILLIGSVLRPHASCLNQRPAVTQLASP